MTLPEGTSGYSYDDVGALIGAQFVVGAVAGRLLEGSTAVLTGEVVSGSSRPDEDRQIDLIIGCVGGAIEGGGPGAAAVVLAALRARPVLDVP